MDWTRKVNPVNGKTSEPQKTLIFARPTESSSAIAEEMRIIIIMNNRLADTVSIRIPMPPETLLIPGLNIAFKANSLDVALARLTCFTMINQPPSFWR
jgi:hypothetical protein